MMQIPEGWKLVPVEPDEGQLMVMAFRGRRNFSRLTRRAQETVLAEMRQVYETALAAAPTAPLETINANDA